MDRSIEATTILDSQPDDVGPTVSERVVKAVADAKGTPALDVEPPLYSVLDPEALDRFVARLGDVGGDGRVEFTYSGCAVSISGSGTITVDEIDADADSVDEPLRS